jgi:hypothetical protein
MADLTNDILHVAWGGAIAALVVSGWPLWLVAPLVVLPREAAQTYHAVVRNWCEFSLKGLRWQTSQEGWLLGKVRDLAGFAVGGWIVGGLL